MNGEKCEALYCREMAEVGVRRNPKDSGSVVKLCLVHWFDHCDDKPINLRGGEVLNPVPKIAKKPSGQTVFDLGGL